MRAWILDGIWGTHSRWEGLRKHLGPEAVIWRYDNSGRKSLASLGQELAGQLAQERGPVHLVGYSMGGLVVREALRVGGGLPVGRVALLHCPHAGSLPARLLPLPAGRDLRPGSHFLQALGESPWSHETLCTWCPADLMVVPGRSGDFAGAKVSLCCRVPAHVWPVYSRGLHGAIREFFATGDFRGRIYGVTAAAGRAKGRESASAEGGIALPAAQAVNSPHSP